MLAVSRGEQLHWYCACVPVQIVHEELPRACMLYSGGNVKGKAYAALLIVQGRRQRVVQGVQLKPPPNHVIINVMPYGKN